VAIKLGNIKEKIFWNDFEFERKNGSEHKLSLDGSNKQS